MQYRVTVTLKGGVLDPQGKAIHNALGGLGFAGVDDVRVGKVILLQTDESVSPDQVDAMCRRLLANTVVETYRVEAVDGSAA